MTRRKTVSEARKDLGALVDRVSKSRDRVVVQRHGKDAAVLLSVEEVRRLEADLEELQDRLDAADAKRILADPNEETIPYEQVRRELGLK